MQYTGNMTDCKMPILPNIKIDVNIPLPIYSFAASLLHLVAHLVPHDLAS